MSIQNLGDFGLLQCNVYASGSQELLVNGSAENGLEGWIVSSGSWVATEEESPRTGKQFFAGETAEGTLYQDVFVTKDMEGKYVKFSSKVANYLQDNGKCEEYTIAGEKWIDIEMRIYKK